MSDKQSDIKRILSKIGANEDARYYLGLYQNIPQSRFAVIKISGSCLEDSLDKIADDIKDLYELEVIPTITHGWGVSLTKRLKTLGIESYFVEGERYTDKIVMEQVKFIAEDTIERLAESLEKKDANVKIFRPEDKVIIAKRKERSNFGEYNGEIVSINIDPIISAIENGLIPLVSPLGISEDGKTIYNLNAATSGGELAKAIDPEKYIMLTGGKGVLQNGKVITEIIIQRHYRPLIETGVLSGGMLKNVDEARESLESRENSEDKSVQIVGPGNLLKELFSHKGEGTYIRTGYQIDYEPLELFDQNKLKTLIEKSFQKRLRPEFFQGEKIAFVEQKLKGFAVLLRNPTGAGNYLDIIAVDNGYMKNGLGKDLFYAISDFQYEDESEHKLSWRCQIDRDTNNWYYRFADGHQRYTDNEGTTYNAFWIGLNTREIEKTIRFLRSRPSNFMKD